MLDGLISSLSDRLRGKAPRTWMAARHSVLAGHPPLPPASEEEIAEAEGILRMRLPPAVRRVYAEVANGGFGPGYGLWGLISGHQDDNDSVVSRYVTYTQDTEVGYENWNWPRSRIVVAHWGCAIVSCLDLSTDRIPVYRFDPGEFLPVGEAEENGEPPSPSLDPFFNKEADSFESWLWAWLEGTLRFELRNE